MSEELKLSHLDESGKVRMVNVTTKAVLYRVATATGRVYMRESTLRLISSQAVPKGNVFETARLAGILAAKKTGEWIPLCHPLPIEGCDIQMEIDTTNHCIEITATTSIHAKTGVEMESLTAVSAAALTIYDMCKAVDKDMTISDIRLISKTKSPLPQTSS
ncbi:MAG: cyclic pyranopterin monophosphate synthase MoaC [Verrucomicrobia bacterium]|jgi:cyclic pyranopterin phosphate synthase|nr:cyclic pyranopterin monophosphate synthase MoaC [Verrucomicrobiota bacterium]